MTYAFKSDEPLNCVFVRWCGILNRKETEAYLRDVCALPCFKAGANLFHDLRQVDVSVSGSVFRHAAKFGPLPSPPSGIRKSALLVSSEVAFGMMRMFATFRQHEGLELDVFMELDDAKAWLELPNEIGDPFADISNPS